MLIKNTNSRYGIVSVLLHWILAVILIGLITLGLYMVNVPISLEKLRLYGWHKEYGILALFLASFRIVWRMINVVPKLEIAFLERVAVKMVHWTFYLLMIALPLSGWCMSSASGFPVSFFGLFVLPDLVAANEETRILLATIHKWLGYILIGVIVLHASAALKHHFINKDNILRRIFYA